MWKVTKTVHERKLINDFSRAKSFDDNTIIKILDIIFKSKIKGLQSDL